MKSIFSSLKDFTFKKFLYFCVIVFTFVYVFAVPSFGEKAGWQRYIIYASMILITSSVVLYIFLYDRFVFKKSTLLIPAFAFFALFGTAVYSHEFRSWVSLVLLVISFYSFLFSFRIIKNKYLVIAIISLAFLLFGLFYIFVYRNEFLHISSVLSGKYRLGGYFDNPNGVGAYAVVAFSTSFYLVLFFKKKIRFLFLAPSLVGLLVGISTGSRTFYLIVLIIISVFLYFFFYKHKFVYLIVLTVLIITGIALLNLPALSALKDRLVMAIETLFGTASKADTSTIQRANYIQYGFYLGSKNMLIGYGVNGFGVMTGVNTYSHCNYSEVICNFGIVGFTLFYAPLIFLFIKSIKDKRIEKSFIVSFFVYYLVVSFTNVLYYKKIYYLVLAFMYYLVYFDREEIKIPVCEKINKIVFTCDTLGHGGAERVITTLSNAFVGKDINVSIIGVSDSTKNGSFYEIDGRVSYIPLCLDYEKRVNVIKRVYLLKKELKRINPDVVISFLPHVCFYTMIACLSLKIPYVVSERNDPKNNPKNLFMKVCKYLSFMKSNGCVFQCKGAKNYYYSSIKEKSEIIYNPLNLKFEPNEYVKKKEKVVLAVGRLEQQKNFEVLISAFSGFNKTHGNEYILKIYGDGSLKSKLENYTKLLNINEKVKFLGVNDNWHEKEFRDALFVLSSNYEGMPNSLIEALALGIPCVSTDCPCGGPKEFIVNYKNGILVSVNNAKELESAMDKAIDMDAKYIYDTNIGLRENLSANSISLQWINYLKSLKKNVYE